MAIIYYLLAKKTRTYYPPPPPSFLTPRLHKLSEQDIFRVEFSSSFGNSTSLSLYSLREYEKTGEETGFVAPFNLRPIRIKVNLKNLLSNMEIHHIRQKGRLIYTRGKKK